MKMEIATRRKAHIGISSAVLPMQVLKELWSLFPCSRDRKLLINLIRRQRKISLRPLHVHTEHLFPLSFLPSLTSSCGWHLLFLWILAEVALPQITLHQPTQTHVPHTYITLCSITHFVIRYLCFLLFLCVPP